MSQRWTNTRFVSDAPYREIAAELRRGISTVRYRPGESHPSARDLQRDHSVASATVQNALKLLQQEGLVYSVQGCGSFVRQHPDPAPRSGDLSDLIVEMRALSMQIAELVTLMRPLACAAEERARAVLPLLSDWLHQRRRTASPTDRQGPHDAAPLATAARDNTEGEGAARPGRGIGWAQSRVRGCAPREAAPGAVPGVWPAGRCVE
ncbi:GntR family transcriptional regulator [Streptomyces sp. NPDC058471]|uniref:GntR family transcriptional regulator n=1 Tax=Streptomyces sp. NPDC058471 TaxID=3346516 RepID=UPI00365A757B